MTSVNGQMKERLDNIGDYSNWDVSYNQIYLSECYVFPASDRGHNTPITPPRPQNGGCYELNIKGTFQIFLDFSNSRKGHHSFKFVLYFY